MKKIISLFVIAASVLLIAPSAWATQYTYDFSSGGFNPRFYPEGSNASNYTLKAFLGLANATLTIDTDLGTANFSGTSEGRLEDDLGNEVGSTYAIYSIDFWGLSVNPEVGDPNNPIFVLGLQSNGAGSEGSFSYEHTFNSGSNQSGSFDVYGGFANITDPNHHRFGDITNMPFNFILRENGAFDIWVKSTGSVGGMSLHGDVHAMASRSEVPEPASMLLLGAGLLGFAGRKKIAAS